MRGVMIQSEHCSLHSYNAISTVLRSDELDLVRGKQNQKLYIHASICGDLFLHSENFDPDRFFVFFA